MELNKVYNLDFLQNNLPDKCAQLIIADPPYFKVKGEFDFIWSDFESYLKDVELWANECKRILADNGTLFWWGDRKKIAYSQVILDKIFFLIDCLVWEKPNSYTETYFKNLRSFISKGHERLLMYAASDGDKLTGWERVKMDVTNFKPLRNYFEKLQAFVGLNINSINKELGHRKAEHAFYWKSTQWDLPTKEIYEALTLSFDLEKWTNYRPYKSLENEFISLVENYKPLVAKYEAERRPFNNHLRLSDIVKYAQETATSCKFDHETIKSERLTSALITTCSRPGDLVVVPFAGSGTECAMAAENGRSFIAYEIKNKYAKMAQKRANKHLKQKKLFYLN